MAHESLFIISSFPSAWLSILSIESKVRVSIGSLNLRSQIFFISLPCAIYQRYETNQEKKSKELVFVSPDRVSFEKWEWSAESFVAHVECSSKSEIFITI